MLGVSNNAISELELGRRTIGINRLLTLCEVLNVTIFDVFKGTPLIDLHENNEIDSKYNQLTYANKKLIRDILEVIIKNQSTNINEDMKRLNRKYNKEVDDYLKEKEEKEYNEDNENYR